jgi:hypothetical protein
MFVMTISAWLRAWKTLVKNGIPSKVLIHFRQRRSSWTVRDSSVQFLQAVHFELRWSNEIGRGNLVKAIGKSCAKLRGTREF